MDRVQEDHICPVCLEDMDAESGSFCKLSPCGHAIHIECQKKCFEARLWECSTCRVDIQATTPDMFDGITIGQMRKLNQEVDEMIIFQVVQNAKNHFVFFWIISIMQIAFLFPSVFVGNEGVAISSKIICFYLLVVQYYAVRDMHVTDELERLAQVSAYIFGVFPFLIIVMYCHEKDMFLLPFVFSYKYFQAVIANKTY